MAKWFKKTRKRLQKRMKKVTPRQKRMILYSLGGALLGLIIIAKLLPTSVEEPEIVQASPLYVETYTVGSQTLTEDTVGNIENLSSITLVAQSPGPVAKIAASEGDTIWRGDLIVQQSSNYSGGNSASVGRQIAAKNYELAQETLKSTVESVAKAREIADKSRENTEELRVITQNSIDGAKALQESAGLVIEQLETDIAAASDPAVVQGLRQQLVSFQGVYNQTEANIKNIEYSTNVDNPPEALANLNRDTVYQATEIQLKSAEISQDIARLSLQSARIAESMSRVVVPFAGTVDRIYVQKGQYLNPGQPVAKLIGKSKLHVVANISGSLASRINPDGTVIAQLGDEQLHLTIDHVTSSPTAGRLYELVAPLPKTYADLVQEGQSVALTLPLYPALSSDSTQFLPLDAVFVTNTDRFVYILEDGKAVKRSVTTGQIISSNIEVTSGLFSQDEVILNRQVTHGQAVTSD